MTMVAKLAPATALQGSEHSMTKQPLTRAKTKLEQHLSSEFAAWLPHLPGDEAMATGRQKAFARFDALGMPHRRIEEWKYSDLRNGLKESVSPLLEPRDIDQDQLKGLVREICSDSAEQALALVFVDGILRPELSDLAQLPEGLTISSLNEALANEQSLLLDIEELILPAEESLAALNTAMMQDGLLLRLAKGTQLKQPIALISFIAEHKQRLFTLRHQIVLEEGAAMSLQEHNIAQETENCVINHLTQIRLGDKARLHHIKQCEDGAADRAIYTYDCRLGEESHYDAFQFSAGGGSSRNQIYLNFDGSHGQAHLNGAVLGVDGQHCDTTISVDHRQPHCSSQENYKFVLQDKARSIFQGKNIVQSIAQKTDSKQMAQALLLSDEAEFDSKPELEIYADDVVCGHGSTSGQIDEDLLFYLRARGISEKEARSLLILAFIGGVLEKIDDEELRTKLNDKTQVWLSTVG